jgi:hypothetical protein
MAVPGHGLPSLDGWLGTGRAGSPRPQERETDCRSDCDSGSHSGAQRVCRSRQDGPAWAGNESGVGGVSGVGVALGGRDVGHREESLTPVRHPLTHTPFRLSSTNHVELAKSNQWSSVKNPAASGKNRSGLREVLLPKTRYFVGRLATRTVLPTRISCVSQSFDSDRSHTPRSDSSRGTNLLKVFFSNNKNGSIIPQTARGIICKIAKGRASGGLSRAYPERWHLLLRRASEVVHVGQARK